MHAYRYTGLLITGLLLLYWPLSFPALGTNTTVTINSLGDLDGNGDGGTGETAVVQAAAACWDARITTARPFALTVNAISLTGGTAANGASSALSGTNVPTAGTINFDNDSSTTWWVDPTPLDSLEFTPDAAFQWRFNNGPAGTDLMFVALHEIGHAHGWLCGAASCGFSPPNNVNYDALMVPQPSNFANGTVVSLQNAAPAYNVPLRGDGLAAGIGSGGPVNELSHPGANGDLMQGSGFQNSPGGQRETISINNVNLFNVTYGDTVNLPPTINAGADQVAECSMIGGSNVQLDASGSTDPESDALAYTWTCPGATLGTPNTAMTSAFVAVNQTLTCRVDATDLAACPPDADTVNVSVVDTTAPSMTVPSDVTAECTAPAGTPVDIGVSVASDICDANVSVSNNAPPVFPLGQTVVNWTATDDDNNQFSDTQIVEITDTEAPWFELSVTPGVLWPPNHKLVTINAQITMVTDTCDADPAVTLLSITSNEPDNGTGDGDTVNDIQGAAFGTDDREFQLRAERSGSGSGRVYTITYAMTDDSGNQTTRQVIVTVPKSRGPG